MNILKRIAAYILRKEFDALYEQKQFLYESTLLPVRQRDEVIAELKTFKMALQDRNRDIEKLNAHIKVVEQRYDEQRRFNADILQSSRIADSVSEIYAPNGSGNHSQKAFLHCKLRFDKRLVELFNQAETPAVQALALVLARNFKTAIDGLRSTFCGGAISRIDIPAHSAEPSIQVNDPSKEFKGMEGGLIDQTDISHG